MLGARRDLYGRMDFGEGVAMRRSKTIRAIRNSSNRLEKALDAQEEVEAEEREDGASPDHECAFPAEGAGDVLLAAP